MMNNNTINGKLSLIKNYLSKSTFTDVGQIISGLENFEKIVWKFFHPFFNLLIEKFSYINLNNLFYNKIDNFMICLFNIKNDNMTHVDFISILYCTIDEICGKFVYLIDENIFVTTEISKDIKENFHQSKFNPKSILFDENLDFLCLVYLKETSNLKRKMIFNFNLFFIEKKNTNEYNLKEYLSGTSVFKRLNKSIPMSKF